jgi:hypothetical protein
MMFSVDILPPPASPRPGEPGPRGNSPHGPTPTDYARPPPSCQSACHWSSPTSTTGSSSDSPQSGAGRPSCYRAATARSPSRPLCHGQHPAADGHGADLQHIVAGRHPRPLGRAVREAPLVGHRSHRSDRTAVLPRRRSQRGRLHQGRAATRPGTPGPDVPGLCGVNEPRSCLRRRRTRRARRNARSQPALRLPTPPLATEIDRALRFMSVTGNSSSSGNKLFVSHEGLLLDYESALSRVDPRTGQVYATSGHLLLIGDRTRDIDGAHVEYFSRIANPIAVKVSPQGHPRRPPATSRPPSTPAGLRDVAGGPPADRCGHQLIMVGCVD